MKIIILSTTMSNHLDMNTTAFVTGGSQGIGREICETLAQNGANVAIASRGDGIYETRDRIGRPNATLAAETDVTDEDSVQSSIESTVDKFGGIDYVVNNAGIAGPTAPVETIGLESWEHTLRVNITGMFTVTKHSLPAMSDTNQGRIINISSISGKRPLVNRTPYTASKMAVIGFSRTLAFELGDSGITVNTICPGPVKGDRLRRVIENQADERGLSYEETKKEMLLDDMALDELVLKEDVAELVSFLASDNAQHITGQDINVSSGVVWY